MVFPLRALFPRLPSAAERAFSVANVPSVLEEYQRLERFGEQEYAQMYDVRGHRVKECYEDAMVFFARAIRVAEAEGRTAEVERLKQRKAEITAVYNHQFRYTR